MSVNNLKKIANYFNADLSVFWSEEEEEVSGKYYISEETAKVAQEISDNKELKLLFDAARSSSPEDLQTVRTMLLALKRKENGGINDN